jgi:hypothetical protein
VFAVVASADAEHPSRSMKTDPNATSSSYVTGCMTRAGDLVCLADSLNRFSSGEVCENNEETCVKG